MNDAVSGVVVENMVLWGLGRLYLDGLVTLGLIREYLDGATWDMHKLADDAYQKAAAGIELALWELDAGHRTEDSVRGVVRKEIATLNPTPR